MFQKLLDIVMAVLAPPIQRGAVAIIFGLTLYAPYGNDMSDWPGWIVLSLVVFFGILIAPMMVIRSHTKKKK